MKQHYTLGPSAAPGWSRCAAKPTRELPYPNTSSEFADWGTVAHDLAERALQSPAEDIAKFAGKMAKVVDGVVEYEVEGASIAVDGEMLSCVKTYVDFVRSIPGELLVEQRVPIDHITGEEGGSGTSDAIVLADSEMVVIDLKGGQGVRVDAYEEDGEDIDLLTGEIAPRRRPNEQAALYGIGALRAFGWMGDFKYVRLVIVQPRLNHVSEHRMTVEELNAFGEFLRERAEATRDPFATATPGDKQCKFCRAKADCAELAAFVSEQIGANFDNLDGPLPVPSDPEVLAAKMRAAPLIEDWIKAVRGAVESRLLSGLPVPGYKLVKGRRGARQWSDEQAVEELLRKQFKLKIEDAYNMKLISPTRAEELLSKEHQRQWAKLAPLIVTPEGGLSVAPISDKRPAVVVEAASDVFNDLTDSDKAEVPADVADLFA